MVLIIKCFFCNEFVIQYPVMAKKDKLVKIISKYYTVTMI